MTCDRYIKLSKVRDRRFKGGYRYGVIVDHVDSTEERDLSGFERCGGRIGVDIEIYEDYGGSRIDVHFRCARCSRTHFPGFPTSGWDLDAFLEKTIHNLPDSTETEMKILYFNTGTLTQLEKEDLSSAGVRFDDLDYVLIVPISAMCQYEASDGEKSWEPHDYELRNFVDVMDGGEWTIGTFRGKSVGIGMSFHA